MGVSDSF